MKKIISLLSVFAMIATMFTTVAFADDNNKFYVEETVDGTNVTLTILLKTNLSIKAASGSLDLTAAYGACDGVAFEKATTEGVTSNLNVNATQKVLAWNMASTDGFDGVLTLGTVTFTNVKADFALPQKKAFTAKNTASVLSSFTNEQVGYAVKAPVIEDEKAATMDAPVAGNDMYGMKTALTKITFKSVANPVVKLAKDGKDSGKTYELPANVKGGNVDIIGIIRYAADVTGEFVLSVFDGETEVVSTSYVAE